MREDIKKLLSVGKNKEEVELNEEDKMLFERLYNLLDDIDDVTDIYHNVANF